MDLLYMDVISVYTVDDWNKSFKAIDLKMVLSDLESGKVLYCPQLSFKLYSEEQFLFTPYAINRKTKNISFDINTDRLQGLAGDQKHKMQLKSALTRFSQCAKKFMTSLFPYYADSLIMGRTSYRPIEIRNRKSSARKDDSRLHIDAFPSSPNQGKRILRLFCNINPYGQNRVWRIGEAFIDVANRFLPKISRPVPGSAKFLHWIGITKSIRTYYDHIMLQIHNHMKLDTDYQKQVRYSEVCFFPGTSWIVSTDEVSHAAISGQYILEQTFLLPVTSMKNPETAPLRILENLVGNPLV